MLLSRKSSSKGKAKARAKSSKNTKNTNNTNNTITRDETTYHGVGFGTNYFHAFSKHAIPIQDVNPHLFAPSMTSTYLHQSSLTTTEPPPIPPPSSTPTTTSVSVTTESVVVGPAAGGTTGSKNANRQDTLDGNTNNEQQPHEGTTTETNTKQTLTETIPKGYFFPLHPDDIISPTPTYNNNYYCTPPPPPPFSPMSNSSSCSITTTTNNSITKNCNSSTTTTDDNSIKNGSSNNGDGAVAAPAAPAPSSSPAAPGTATNTTTAKLPKRQRKFKRKKIIPSNFFSILRPSSRSVASSTTHNSSSSTNHEDNASPPLPYPSTTTTTTSQQQQQQQPQLPQIALGATYTTTLTPSTGHIHLTGTLHGRVNYTPTLQRTHLPHLNCIQISCGKRHVLALFERSVTMSWGNGYFGQLGHGLDHVVCDGPTVIERLLGRVVGGDVVRVEAGGMHSAAIVDLSGEGLVNKGGLSPFWDRRFGGGRSRRCKGNGSDGSGGGGNGSSGGQQKLLRTKVFHWGSNRFGQCAVEGGKSNAVGYPLPMVDVYNPDTGKEVSFVSLSLGKRHSVGISLSSPPGGGGGGSGGTSIHSGSGSGGGGGNGGSGGIISHGEVYSWGSTASGRCGHGNLGSSSKSRATSVISPRRIEALRNVNIVQVSAGDSHTLALSESGRVFSWGIGSSGQLGHGHTMQLLSPRLLADLDFANRDGMFRGKEGGKEALSKAAEEDGVIGASDGESTFQFGDRESGLNTAFGDEEGITWVGDDINSSSTSHIHYPSTPKKATQRPSPLSPNSTNSTNTKFKIIEPPKIIQICAAGSYSAAVSSTGDLYTWGCGDGEQLGHSLPSSSCDVPNIKPSSLGETPTSGATPPTPSTVRNGWIGTSGVRRIRESTSFDSRLNVLIPRRVECLRQLGLNVEDLELSTHCMALLCSAPPPSSSLGSDSDDTDRVGDHDVWEIGKTLGELGNERKIHGTPGRGGS